MKSDKNWNEVKKVLKEQMGNSFREGKQLMLGSYYTHMICSDLKHLGFSLSRYKFVSKLMLYREKVSVLELGCQEAIGSLIFQQNNDLEKYVGIDFDHEAIKWNENNLPNEYIFIEDNFFECNKIEGQKFDIVFSLDVIEHIDRKYEDNLCKIVVEHVKDDGIAVVGTPNIYMDPFACDASKAGHINLYDQKRLYSLMNKYFNNVFIFSMNDEIVHTGFAPMSCYIFAVCAGKK